MIEFFRWCDATWISNVIRNSTWIFPIVEVFHLLGLTMLLGTVTLIDARILGLGMRRQSISKVGTDLTPWMLGGAALTICTGIPLFLSEAMKCYGNAAFPYKMSCLAGGLVLVALTQRSINSPKTRMNPALMKVVAVLSLCLWYGVALAGRAIAFV